jgi:glycosyltransferase involved in cell wall biosynthesis
MSPIDILFDHQALATQRHGGVSRYVVELARALQNVPGVRARLFAPAWLSSYVRAGDPLHPWSFALTGVQRGLQQRAAVLTPLLRLALRLTRPQVLHETAYGPAVRVPRGTAVVTTLHDMTVERYPQGFDQAARRIADKLAALRRADAIVCISENTRRDLLAAHPEFGGRCAVVPHGVVQQVAVGPRPARLPPQYLLYVGGRGSYKNFARLVQALGQAPGLPPTLQLLCFGGGPLRADELAQCGHAGWAAPRVLQIDGDDALLAQAYRHAELFVFPSLYEGFGMPLTEAMVQGCAVACSRASSFPEVCADSAAYFDPEDSDDIARCLAAVLLDPARRVALGHAAAARGRHFSWAECATRTAAVYRRAVAGEAQP